MSALLVINHDSGGRCCSGPPHLKLHCQLANFKFRVSFISNLELSLRRRPPAIMTRIEPQDERAGAGAGTVLRLRLALNLNTAAASLHASLRLRLVLIRAGFHLC